MWGGGGEESFRFNFGGDASHKSDDNDKEEECAHQDYRLRPTKKVDCSADIERGRAGTDAMFQQVSVTSANGAVAFDIVKDEDSKTEAGQQAPRLDQDRDLIPRLYEGGFKVWECSRDLVAFLHETEGGVLPKAPLRVLELGCGQALPAIHVARNHETSHLCLQDFNQEVLEQATAPNVGRALLRNGQCSTRVEFVAGGWEQIVQLLDTATFTVILASETIYDPQSHDSQLRTIARLLAKDEESLCLLAQKDYYFGVGGSLHSFLRRASDYSLHSETLRRYSDGASNVRSIVKLVWQQQQHEESGS